MFARRDTLTRHKKKYYKVRKENEKDMENLLNRLIREMKDLKKTNSTILKKNNTILNENKKLHKDTSNIKGNTTTNSHNTQNTQNTQNIQNRYIYNLSILKIKIK